MYSCCLITKYMKDGSLNDPVLDDVRDFRVCEEAMVRLGFTDSDRNSIYKLVAALLHLGNISFEDNHEDSKGIHTLHINSLILMY